MDVGTQLLQLVGVAVLGAELRAIRHVSTHTEVLPTRYTAALPRAKALKTVLPCLVLSLVFGMKKPVVRAWHRHEAGL